MSLSIAVAGKGGVGKTTFAALLVRALCEAGQRPVLAVDADPNSNLAEALGVEKGTSLADIREEGSTPEGSPDTGIGRVRHLENRLQMEAIVEAEGFDLITMGQPEGPKCYCYVNNLLRTSLDKLAKSYSAMVLDNEAGLEHLSRRTTNDVDALVAVMEPSQPALRAVKRILELSNSLPVRIGRRYLVATKVKSTGLPETLDAALGELDAERLPDVPYDEKVEQAINMGEDIHTLDADTPDRKAVKQIVEILRKNT